MLGGKADYMAGGRASPAPSKFAGYDRYLAQGPHPEIEMSRLDIDQLPLLNAQQGPGYYEASRSNISLASYSPYSSPHMTSPPQPPPVPAMPPGQDFREAALHRPYPPSRQASGYAPPPQEDEDVNMAGRGAFRAY